MHLVDLEIELFEIIRQVEHLLAVMVIEGLNTKDVEDALNSLYWSQRAFGI